MNTRRAALYTSPGNLLVAIILLGSTIVGAAQPRTAVNHYVLSGSVNGTAAIAVDEDLDVYLNGSLIYSDANAVAGNRAPINVSANPGDTLRLVVRDTFGGCASLSTVYLTNQTAQYTIADPGFNLGCGRPNTDQGVVHDITFTVPNFSPQAGDLISADGRLMLRTDPTTGVRTVLTDFTNAAEGPTGSAYRVATGTGGVIYVTDGASDEQSRLFQVFANGTRIVVSDSTNGTQGSPFHTTDSPAVDTDGSILVTDRGIGGGGNDSGLWRVDPTTGVRTKIMSYGGHPRGVTLDATNRILIGDAEGGTDCHTFGGCGAIYSIDRTTGALTMLADFGNSAQGPLGEDAGYALAKDNDGTILASDEFAPPCPSACGVVFRWIPATGKHTYLTEFGDPTQGAATNKPWGIAVASNGTIFVSGCVGSNGQLAICTVNRTNGFRTVFSDSGNAAQGPPDLAFSLAVMQPPSVIKELPRMKVTGGDILVGTPGQGIILRSPNSTTCKLLSIDNAGAMVFAIVQCP